MIFRSATISSVTVLLPSRTTGKLRSSSMECCNDSSNIRRISTSPLPPWRKVRRLLPRSAVATILPMSCELRPKRQAFCLSTRICNSLWFSSMSGFTSARPSILRNTGTIWSAMRNKLSEEGPNNVSRTPPPEPASQRKLGSALAYFGNESRINS
ncbi:MAG: Uncharacterised protein [Pseudidiomarina mangrovi]|nr:MAG: Uncharacterised protein [Pseudidiomarina mangrovi]